MFWKKRQKRQAIRAEGYTEPRLVPNQWQASEPPNASLAHQFNIGALAAKGIHPEMSKEAKRAILTMWEEDLARWAIPEPPPRFKTVEEADRWLEEHA